MELAGINLKFAYKDAFEMVPNVGYETLIYDCLIGDASLFQRADMIEASWSAVDPALVNPGAPELYPAGSSGPKGADELLARSGHHWSAMQAE
jgi:glucose-6-phosphate 1-dehydrogenase